MAPNGCLVQWLDALPASFAVCVLANEVLDAMPVALFGLSENGTVQDRGVTLDGTGAFAWEDRPARAPLARSVAARLPPLPGYVSEINLQAEAWMQAMGGWLAQGADRKSVV